MIYRERIEKGGQARLYMIIVIVTRYNLSISMVGGGVERVGVRRRVGLDLFFWLESGGGF